MTTDRAGERPGWDAVPHVFVVDVDHPELEPEDRHHLTRVLRLRPGDDLTVSDGRGAWRRCQLRDAALAPRGPAGTVPSPRPPITVGFALVKGQRPELVVQKLTEVGVDVIAPFLADRSVVRWDALRAASAHKRLTKVAREAAMQSRRCWLPEVRPLCTFDAVAAVPGAARADRGGGPPALDLPVVLVGPEGGWSERERQAAIPVVTLNDTVLRAETASIAAGVALAGLRAGLWLEP